MSCVVAVALLAGQASALQSPREIFERAKMLDNNNQHLGEAIRLYNQVISEAAGQRALAAEAQYRLGLIYNRLGDKAKAQRAFKAVVSQYPDQTDVAERARKRITTASVSAKKEPEFVVKRTGPSTDGLYLASFTCSGGPADLLHPVVDSARRRLYIPVSRMREPADDAERKRVESKGLRYVYEPSTLVVIDTDTNSVVKTIPLSVFCGGSMSLNPLTGKLYCCAQVDGYVKVIDLNTFSQTKIRIPGYPTASDVNPGTNKIYITSQGFSGNDKLFVIDGATGAVAGPVDLDGGAGRVVVNASTNRIYCLTDTKTRVFNGVDNAVLTDLPGIDVIWADPVHNRLYGRAFTGDKVDDLRVLDGNTHNLIASLEFGVDRVGFALAASADRLYVGLLGHGLVSVIDRATLTELGRLMLPVRALALDTAANRLYCSTDFDPPLIRSVANTVFEGEIPEEFSDSFDSARFDPAWAIIGGDGIYSLSDSPGHLRMRMGLPSGPTPRPLLVRKFRGDSWTLETRVSYSTGESGGGRTFEFVVAFGAPPMIVTGTRETGVYVSRYRGDWNGRSPGVIGPSFLENGAGTDGVSLPLNTADSYVWRIRRDGRTVSIERSDDGITFTPVGTHTFGPQIDGAIQFFGITCNTFSKNAAYADFDYVRLSKMAPQGRP